jgi:hypothetical protein
MTCRNAFSRRASAARTSVPSGKFPSRVLTRALLLLPILLLSPPHLRAEAAVWETEIRLPLDLYTGDGLLLRKGGFDLEVRWEKEHYSLVFMKDQKVVAIVNGQETATGPTETVIPVVGTHYLRSTAIPLGTAEERQLSKTGRPQYQDDDREWDISLRVFSGSDDEVHFVFQRKKDWDHWEGTVFKLFRSNPVEAP